MDRARTASVPCAVGDGSHVGGGAAEGIFSLKLSVKPVYDTGGDFVKMQNSTQKSAESAIRGF